MSWCVESSWSLFIFHADSNNQPTLPEMIGNPFDIPGEVGDRYDEFGTLLLNDKAGTKMETFENDYNNRAQKITRCVLREWLKGAGSELSWQSLIVTLQQCKLLSTARKIQKALKT